jgi:hypothetical protein
MKKFTPLTISIFLISNCLYSQTKISYLYNQDMVDSCHKYTKYSIIEVSNGDTAPVFRPITDLTPLIKYGGFHTLIVNNTDITEFDPLKWNGISTLVFKNNSKLKTLKNLQFTGGLALTVDNCSSIESFELNSDTNYKYGHSLRFINNPNLKSVKISLDNPNYETTNDFEIGNNPLLKKIEIYNSKFTTQTIKIYNNTILDSVFINKMANINTRKSSFPVLTPNDYLYYSGIDPFDVSIILGAQLLAYNNSNLTFIGGGFEKDSIVLTRLKITDNAKLNNLCVLQSVINKFPTPDPRKIKEFIYSIKNNASGANSIEEVLAKDCSKQSELNHANTSDNLIIYPNPVKDAVYFKLPEQIPIDKCIIRNIEGKILHVFTDVNMQHSVELPEIASGLYFFEIYSKDKKYVAKFMRE